MNPTDLQSTIGHRRVPRWRLRGHDLQAFVGVFFARCDVFFFVGSLRATTFDFKSSSSFFRSRNASTTNASNPFIVSSRYPSESLVTHSGKTFSTSCATKPNGGAADRSLVSDSFQSKLTPRSRTFERARCLLFQRLLSNGRQRH